MPRVRQQLACRILVAVVCGVLGHLCIFNTSASAQRYFFGRTDFGAG